MSRYALPLSSTLPSVLPVPPRYPFATQESDGWYVVVAVSEDEAVIEDVRRSDWPLPAGVIDRRPQRRPGAGTDG